ncbi:16S rRNA (adenine(1518)-N(6)/adenine(1519)-N(6))-dimethyltransferase RsmA [Ligilactobacillus ceti]|uniref:Ribosomal RNA small subunit methyltransferase A n=1 Tax=Ligilactobacillus ceti DSM 22408 TaxID=1122146 RepID=A0A0R2KJ54_9LACO|nr:16S rRNA (adenine(1518)-N(6)/adenine(1519)-N(6))-dimethyltransferase RsmA [Ligilactobacillus ceti]KRN89401.1 16S ribosomal RNA methyltransferase KsgA Dim1 family protein [Ligilactobacillus ceti DSM 22408]
MNKPEIGSPTRTRAIMETYGLAFKKSLGQNFLTDLNILKKIVAAADVTKDDNVLEIGPGIGALTEQIALNANQVLALEIDQRLLPVLDETLADYSNVKVVHQDVLKADLNKLLADNFSEQKNLKLVANLPYYITTPIIMHLLAEKIDVELMAVMMQKEVADRLTAQPGSKSYGSLAVAVQYEMDTEIAFIVPKTAFVPQPQVDSCIVVLRKKKHKTLVAQDEDYFQRMIKGIFMHRRKSLWNNLLSMYGKKPETKEKLTAALAQAEIEPGVRAEKLSIAKLIDLSDALMAENL